MPTAIAVDWGTSSSKLSVAMDRKIAFKEMYDSKVYFDTKTTSLVMFENETNKNSARYKLFAARLKDSFYSESSYQVLAKLQKSDSCDGLELKKYQCVLFSLAFLLSKLGLAQLKIADTIVFTVPGWKAVGIAYYQQLIKAVFEHELYKNPQDLEKIKSIQLKEIILIKERNEYFNSFKLGDKNNFGHLIYEPVAAVAANTLQESKTTAEALISIDIGAGTADLAFVHKPRGNFDLKMYEETFTEDFAGNKLTEIIQKLRGLNDFDQAEVAKIAYLEKTLTEPQVAAWTKHLCDATDKFAKGLVKDLRGAGRLEAEIGVCLTGGSSLLHLSQIDQALPKKIVAALKSSFQAGGVDGGFKITLREQLAGTGNMMDRTLSRISNAKFAVAVGASLIGANYLGFTSKTFGAAQPQRIAVAKDIGDIFNKSYSNDIGPCGHRLGQGGVCPICEDDDD